MWHYVKFFSFHAVGLWSLTALLLGSHFITIGLMGVLLLYIVGDAISGDDVSEPVLRNDRLLTWQLWLALPLMFGILFASCWRLSQDDLFQFGAVATAMTGYDFIAAKSATSLFQQGLAVVLTALMIGMIGTIAAHELVHRTRDRISLMVGRWLLAFSFDTSFSIEHVYGHHRYVATAQDPATAPRGRNVYWHIIVSTVRGNASAWRIESHRLTKQGHTVMTWRNRFLRGQVMSVVLLMVAFGLAGWQGLAFLMGSGVVAKALLEVVNYMEHYGLVREPSKRVEVRHSWNTNKRISSWSLFNLTRHSHHHAKGNVHYQDLKPYPDAPMMISGYLSTLIIALVPPIWHRLMAPKLNHWDTHFASESELSLLTEPQRKR